MLSLGFLQPGQGGLARACSHALGVCSASCGGWRGLGTLAAPTCHRAASPDAAAAALHATQPKGAAAPAAVSVATKPSSSSSSLTADSQVLGMLSSLLADHQTAAREPQQAQAAAVDVPCRAGAALQDAASATAATTTSSSSLLCSGATSLEQPCAPDSSAASSGVVRMESQLLFDACWRRFKEKHGMHFVAPREIVWLNGAPGSGKGISTPHILKVRGMTRAVCMSSLLSAAPEARRYIEAGEMIADSTVGDLLLEALLQPASTGLSTAALNAVVDGFPRTAVQVDFVKLLMDKLNKLHQRFIDSPYAARFPRPAFKVVVLYVDEATSIQRQLQRAVTARTHNARAKDAGVLGETGGAEGGAAGGAVGDAVSSGGSATHPRRLLQEERPTDLDVHKAQKRYQIFKQHYSAILRLKQFLPFHLIDAMGSKQDTQEQVTQELRHQSSLDLSEDAYLAIRHLPCAKDLQQTARQQLVSRLDSYCASHRPLFGRVLALLQAEVLPLLEQGSLAGGAEYVTQDALLSQHPVCVDMLLDVLSDRGFRATYARETLHVPAAFDAASGAISCRPLAQHRFRFAFQVSSERDAAMLKALEIAARITEAARSNMAAGAAAAAAAAAAAGGAAAALPGGGQQQLAAWAAPPLAAAAAAAAGHHHPAAHAAGVLGGLHAAALTMSFIPEHLDNEAKARAQDLRRVALAGRGDKAAAAPASAAASIAAAAAAAAASRAAGSSCSSGACGGSCGGSGGGSDAPGSQHAGSEEPFVIHRCLRPDLQCGHSMELEVVSADG